MGTQREEVIIQMGISNEMIDAQLGITTRKMAGWRNKQKSEEQEYTEFWKRELQKRDDAARDADVRAASRANRARALQRERDRERTVRRNTEIGAGSIPENFKTIGANAGAVSGKQAAESFAKSFSGALRGLRSFFGFSLIAAIGGGVLELWDMYTKKLADLRFGNSPMVDMRGERLEAARLEARRTIADRDERAEKQRQRSAEMGKEAEALLRKHDELGDARVATQLESITNEKEAAEVRKRYLEADERIAKAELESLRMGQDKLKILDAEVKLERLKASLIQNQNQLNAIATAARDAKNKPIRDKLSAAFGSGQFNSEISQMMALQADMGIASQGGNISSRERFLSDAADFANVRKSLQEKIGNILKTDPRQDAREAMINKILDAVAPISKEGVPVRITNNE